MKKFNFQKNRKVLETCSALSKANTVCWLRILLKDKLTFFQNIMYFTLMCYPYCWGGGHGYGI